MRAGVKRPAPKPFNKENMAVKVEFKFGLHDKVVTSLDDKGLIHGLFFDKAGNQYLVLVKGGTTSWMTEDQLKKAEGRV